VPQNISIIKTGKSAMTVKRITHNGGYSANTKQRKETLINRKLGDLMLK